MKRLLSLLVLTVIFLTSCLKSNELPDEPRLTGSRFETGSDKAVLYLSFTDGDGNFGLEENDTSGVFAECIRKFNLYAEYYELQNGQWTHVVIDPCDGPFPDSDAPFYYVIPWAKPTGQDQSQDGEIKIEMNDWYLPSDFDTIQFRVKIVDRNMNESNELIVGPVVKN